MSRKLSKIEMIFVPFMVIGLVVILFIAGVYFGYSNDEILKVLIPLGFIATAIERFLKRNKKMDKSLELNEKERRGDSMLIWAGLSGLSLILMTGFGLYLADYLSRNGHEISIFYLLFIFVGLPIIVFTLYLLKRSQIKKKV